MEQVKDLMVEEVVNEVSDEAVSTMAADANKAHSAASKCLLVLGGVGAFFGVRALYKKVIKPKIDARKAKKALAKSQEAYVEAITGNYKEPDTDVQE